MRRPDPHEIAGALIDAVAWGLAQPEGNVDPQALRVAVRLLAVRLVDRAPGRSVELRIPPLIAVQCVAGPAHTRGTPPNVVETDPASWVLLATGRLSWAEALATGRLRASGSRADLSDYLPLQC